MIRHKVWVCKTFSELMSYKNQTKFSVAGFKHIFININQFFSITAAGINSSISL